MAVAVLIRMESPGPVLFVQQRMGLNKRRFNIYKFRTMVKKLHPTWKSVVAVANLAFGSRSREAGGVLMVGDAAASISPLCGDGMAMALRAGEMLTPLLHRFLAGNMSSSAMLQAYERHWRQEFALRLKMGRVLQKVLLTPSWTQVAVMLLRTWPRLGQDLIRLTRGN